MQPQNHFLYIFLTLHSLDTLIIFIQVKMFSGDLAYVRSTRSYKRPSVIAIPLRSMKSPSSSPIDTYYPDENKDLEEKLNGRLPYPRNFLTKVQKTT